MGQLKRNCGIAVAMQKCLMRQGSSAFERGRQWEDPMGTLYLVVNSGSGQGATLRLVTPDINSKLQRCLWQ